MIMTLLLFFRNKGDELCFKVNITDSSYTPPSIENEHIPHFVSEY